MSLEQLKQNIKDTPISSVIGHYLSLTRRGTQTLAICPFHQDTKPSLNVNDQKGMFMCFACNTGGDHITFVEKYKNLSFIESLKEISNIVGFDFDSFSNEGKNKNPEKEMAYKVFKNANTMYQKLRSQADSYLSFKGQRKVNDETENLFELGHTPNGNVLLKYLNSIPSPEDREFALKVAKKYKLIKENNGQLYDTFRERIIFPIWDYQGKTIGFTSRATKDQQVPKYLNSSESPIFNKKNLLYPFHIAKKVAREKDYIIICEGNMDAMMLHQHGFQNTVAIMGTAFNENLIPLLINVTNNIFLALDNDQAGHKAADRINEMFLRNKVLCKRIDLLDFKDPDEFLMEKGALEFQKQIDNAESFIDFSLKNLFKSKSPSSTEKKIECLHESFKLLSPLRDSIVAFEKIVEFARTIGIKSSDQQIIDEYKGHLQKTPKTNSLINSNFTKKSSTAATTEASKPAKSDEQVKSVTYPKSIELLIREVIKYPNLFEHAKWPEVLDLLWRDEVKQLLNALKKLYLEIDDDEFPTMALDLLNQKNFTSSIKSVVGAAVYNSGGIEINSKERDKLIEQLIIRLKKDDLQMKRDNLLNIKLNLLSPEESQKVLSELSQIQQQIRSLN